MNNNINKIAHVGKSKKCTGCSACMCICPKQCIEITSSNTGDLDYPVVDEDKCIKCGKCLKSCQINNAFEFCIPVHTYAGYSTDDNVYSYAASGGIASEIYRYACDKKYFMMGTKFSREHGVTFQKINSREDIEAARDSKYVYSNPRDIYENYKRELISGNNAFFIGLPCQVAALLTYLKVSNVQSDKLTTIDLICHGTPSWKYFDEHLSYIEQKKHKKIERIRFRDPIYIFFFRGISGKGKDIYHAGMHEGDEYYRAFSQNLTFKECCYSCDYARKERISDISIGDFSGLGTNTPFQYIRRKNSLVLANTVKGNDLLKEMKSSKYISLYERQYNEAYTAEGNPNLRHPSVPHRNRSIFLEEYSNGSSFEDAVRKALREEFEEWNRTKYRVQFKRWIYAMVPRSVKEKIKNIIKNREIHHEKEDE